MFTIIMITIIIIITEQKRNGKAANCHFQKPTSQVFDWWYH